MSNGVIVEHVETNLVITFNRPEIPTPLSIEILNELSSMVGRMENDRIAGRLIFSGVGNVFASGADLREIAFVDARGARDFAKRGQDLMIRISQLPVSTIAAVNGVCFGGALDLALACDRRIASPDAVFSHPGATLGIMTGWGGTQRLPRLVGAAAALEMFFTAKRVDAADALRLGLVDEIADDPLACALSA